MLGVKAAAVLAAFLVCVRAAANYCGAAMCGKSDTHTFCQYTEGPGPQCSGYIDDRMSGAEKARVVARMNRRRSEAARGRTQLPPASNMLELRWVEELAREAQLWADQCVPPRYPEEHDACRDLYSITVGQCVASVVGEAPGLRPESMVDTWFLQGRQHPGAVSMYAMDGKKSPADFAQMLWARTYLVGCARSRFMTEVDGRLRAVTRLVCNFAPRGPGGGGGGALWGPGAPAAACPQRARPDPALPGLCAFHHNESFAYDVTNATVLKEQLVLDAILEIEQNDSLDYHGSLDQIYMTKMVAASMIDQTDERPQYDFADKKVPAELTTPADKKILANITDDNNKNIIDDVIAQMIGETSTTGRVTKMTLNIVGRPKSYNIKELNLDHKVSENETTRSVDSAKEDDAYRDYEIDDLRERGEPDFIESVIEINVTTSLTPSSASVKIENATGVMIATGIPTIITTTTETVRYIASETSNALHTHIEDKNTTPYVQNDILKRLLDLSEKTNENNPSDPETAQQLEEALDNMEKALAAPVSTKVRRELRSPPEEPRSEHPSPRTEVPKEQSQSQRFRDIGTPDSAPIMAILTRYAPLIKGYDSIFSRSAASSTSHSLLLLLEGIVSKTLYSIHSQMFL